MMKKILAVLLLCVLLTGLCACGGKDEGGSAPSVSQSSSFSGGSSSSGSSSAASDTDAVRLPPASSTDAQVSAGTDETSPAPISDAMAAAQACIGKPIADLYAAVGAPLQAPEYAASCLQEGAQDGMLYYDGFYVWTVRTDTEELVHSVDLIPQA